jgi:hypothetical protein
MESKVYHCYIEYMNDLLGDAQEITRSLVSLRTQLATQSKPLDKELYESASNLINKQHNLVDKVNSYFVHSKPEHFGGNRKIAKIS